MTQWPMKRLIHWKKQHFCKVRNLPRHKYHHQFFGRFFQQQQQRPLPQHQQLFIDIFVFVFVVVVVGAAPKVPSIPFFAKANEGPVFAIFRGISGEEPFNPVSSTGLDTILKHLEFVEVLDSLSGAEKSFEACQVQNLSSQCLILFQMQFWNLQKYQKHYFECRITCLLRRIRFQTRFTASRPSF